MYGNSSVAGFETVFVAYKDPKLVINNKEFDEVVARHGFYDSGAYFGGSYYLELLQE